MHVLRCDAVHRVDTVNKLTDTIAAADKAICTYCGVMLYIE